MIHKVKYGMMEVVLDQGSEGPRAPDLVFTGANKQEFAVFFAPFGTREATAMQAAYWDYYAPYEALVLSEEEKEADDDEEKS